MIVCCFHMLVPLPSILFLFMMFRAMYCLEFCSVRYFVRFHDGLIAISTCLYWACSIVADTVCFAFIVCFCLMPLFSVRAVGHHYRWPLHLANWRPFAVH